MHIWEWVSNGTRESDDAKQLACDAYEQVSAALSEVGHIVTDPLHNNQTSASCLLANESLIALLSASASNVMCTWIGDAGSPHETDNSQDMNTCLATKTGSQRIFISIPNFFYLIHPNKMQSMLARRKKTLSVTHA